MDLDKIDSQMDNMLANIPGDLLVDKIDGNKTPVASIVLPTEIHKLAKRVAKK